MLTYIHMCVYMYAGLRALVLRDLGHGLALVDSDSSNNNNNNNNDSNNNNNNVIVIIIVIGRGQNGVNALMGPLQKS